MRIRPIGRSPEYHLEAEGRMEVLTERQRYVAGAAALSVLLVVASSVAMPAAYGFDIAALAHPGSIVDKGPGGANLLRWGALLDMVSYLPLAVVVLYLHVRLRERNPELVALGSGEGHPLRPADPVPSSAGLQGYQT